MFLLCFTLGLLSAAHAATLFTCNMDSISICGMTQRQNDDFDWTRRIGSTTSVSTGPTRDHTSTTGNTHNYIYIETSYPRTNGDVAEISTPTFTYAGESCVSFWYNMYGATIGRLEVSYTDTSGEHVLYTMSGNRGTAWRKANLNIPALSTSFKVSFRGYVGTSFTGDIALDDILVTTGVCGSSGVSTVATTPASLTSFSCDFETSAMCGFTQERGDDFDWLWHIGGTSSISTGPMRDHTRGQGGTDSTGHYMYIETSLPRSIGDAARMDTPVLGTGSGKSCLSFFYNMYGATIGTLNVYLSVSGVNSPPVWSKSTQQSEDAKWLFAQVSLSANMPAFKVVFEGVAGSSFTGDIGVDDINVKQGNCFTNPLG